MNTSISHTIQQALYKILSPLIRLLLRHRIPFSAFSDIAKRVYVEQAKQHFKLPGKKLTSARIAILTGINRHEIAKLADIDEVIEPVHFSRAGRIIRAWLRDTEYLIEGFPRELPMDGELSMTSLIKRHAGDVPVRALVDDLLETDAIVETSDGNYKLTTNAFVPVSDFSAKLEIAAKAINELMHTIENNTQSPQTSAQFQRTLRYFNVPEFALKEIQEWMAMNGQLTLEKSDIALSQIVSSAKKQALPQTPAHRIGIGLYYFQIPNNQDSQNE